LMHAMKKKGFTHEIYWTWTGRKKREKHIWWKRYEPWHVVWVPYVMSR
jgi:hypothetical protein